MAGLNLAGRSGRWSAAHWKTAAFGWIAFAVATMVVGGVERRLATRRADPRPRQLPAPRARERPRAVEDGHRQRADVRRRGGRRRPDALAPAERHAHRLADRPLGRRPRLTRPALGARP